MPRLSCLLVPAVCCWLAQPSVAVTIDWATVGDPGNACDTQDDGCFGSVDYVYRIGKYEVTNAQYAEFLNAVAATDTYWLYKGNMGSGLGGITRTGGQGSFAYSAIVGREAMPVMYVSFYDALRFANWLHNGQPAGAQDSTTTEDGAYTFSGATSVSLRNAGATIFLPTENEWYKAAYYDAVSMSYNPYPFADGFNGAVCEGPAGTTSHSANCAYAVDDLTAVGAYNNSPSEYGTFDQGGNLYEWNETIIVGPLRGIRGGNWIGAGGNLAASDRGFGFNPTTEGGIGFRVAMIPEPGTALLLAVGLAGLAAAGRRRALWPSVPWREMP